MDPVPIEVRFGTVEELAAAFEGQIQKGGYFVICNEPSPRTTPVLVRFLLPGLAAPLEVRGEVAFAAMPDSPVPGLGAGMAIQFQQISPQVLKAFQAALTVARAEGMGPPEQPLQPASAQEEATEWGDDQPADSGESDDAEVAEPDETTARSVLARLNQMSGEQLYFLLRQMPIHHKVVAAKRGNRAVRAILIQEGNKKIINFLLQNPQLSIPEVIQILKMPNVSQEVVQNIARNSNWNQMEEVKFSIVTNPKTPLPLALTVLLGLTTPNLAKLAKSQATKAQVKSNALKLLEQRRK